MANDQLVTYGAPASKYFSVAPAGTDVPTSATDELAAAFQTLKVSSDGITPSIDLGKGDPIHDWAGDALLDAPSEPSSTVEVPILSQTKLAEQIKFGTANVKGDGENVSSAFDGTVDEFVVVVDELWNGTDGKPTRLSRLVYPRAVPNDISLGSHTRTGAVIDTVTFDNLSDESGNQFYHYTAAKAASTETAGA